MKSFEDKNQSKYSLKALWVKTAYDIWKFKKILRAILWKKGTFLFETDLMHLYLLILVLIWKQECTYFPLIDDSYYYFNI